MYVGGSEPFPVSFCNNSTINYWGLFRTKNCSHMLTVKNNINSLYFQYVHFKLTWVTSIFGFVHRIESKKHRTLKSMLVYLVTTCIFSGKNLFKKLFGPTLNASLYQYFLNSIVCWSKGQLVVSNTILFSLYERF